MQLSPLILKQHFVINISVKASIPDFSSNDELAKAMGSGMSNILTKVECAKNEENPRLWKVGLVVSTSPNEVTSFCPYAVEAELLGFFEVHQNFAEDLIEDLVTCNGPAILFGSLRELVLLITGRGPMPPFLLPSVNFTDGSKENRKKAVEAQGKQLEKKNK